MAFPTRVTIGVQAVGIAHHSLGRKYERMLLNGRNYYRWVEYSLSASLMAVLIALLSVSATRQR